LSYDKWTVSRTRRQIDRRKGEENEKYRQGEKNYYWGGGDEETSSVYGRQRVTDYTVKKGYKITGKKGK